MACAQGGRRRPLSSLASPSVGRGVAPTSVQGRRAGLWLELTVRGHWVPGVFFFGWLLILAFCCFVLPFLRYD